MALDAAIVYLHDYEYGDQPGSPTAGLLIARCAQTGIARSNSRQINPNVFAARHIGVRLRSGISAEDRGLTLLIFQRQLPLGERRDRARRAMRVQMQFV